MRITVDLPDELMRKAKARSAERGESLKEMFARVLEREVNMQVSRGGQHRMQLPLLGETLRPSVDLSNGDIAEILDADDADHLCL
ncbi:hypothetical protein [Nesterenkonia haasae]|uniref:hypothetical protein n=1 Tax=Nesterenkonia haasae TaxID=2587813 RepID=UPI001390A884|nr:hypothetical protein [Nesterenkonia haasae]NDK32794.1 hypothetical protein [Nesterenkonia haasae]